MLKDISKKGKIVNITYTFPSDQNETFLLDRAHAGHQTPPSRRTATASPEITQQLIKNFFTRAHDRLDL